MSPKQPAAPDFSGSVRQLACCFSDAAFRINAGEIILPLQIKASMDWDRQTQY
jgi:hypothetical protein